MPIETLYHSGDLTGRTKMPVMDVDVAHWRKQNWVTAEEMDALMKAAAEAEKSPAAAEDAATAGNAATDGGTAAGAQASAELAKVNPSNIIRRGDNVALAGDEYAIVKFSEDPKPNDGINDTDTIWELDLNNGVYRRFLSPQSVELRYGLEPGGFGQFLGKHLYEVDPGVLDDPDSVFNARFLPKSMSVQDDGSVPDYTGPAPGDESESGLSTIYGKPKADADTEDKIVRLLGNFFNFMVGEGALDQSTVDRYLNDGSGEGQRTAARYVNAWLYGGYSLNDIFRDIKARELSDAGDSSYDGYRGFSDTIPASDWKSGPEGASAAARAGLEAPRDMEGFDLDLLDLPLFSISGQAFQTIVPPIDWTSPEFREEAESIRAAWYGILIQQASAETAQQKAVADSNWDMFKKSLERKYGLQISDNANEAWTQLEGLTTGMIQRGLNMSGIHAKLRDKYLQDVRKTDQRIRDVRADEEEVATRNRLLKTGSAQDIAEATAVMDREDAEAGLQPSEYRSVKWGLRPNPDERIEVTYPDGTKKSVTTSEYFGKENILAMYPELGDRGADLLSKSVVDESGNYRSDLYQNMFARQYDLSQDKTSYQQSKLYQRKLAEEKRAYAPFTGGTPFSSYDPSLSAEEYATMPGGAREGEAASAAADVSKDLSSAGSTLPKKDTDVGSEYLYGNIEDTDRKVGIDPVTGYLTMKK